MLVAILARYNKAVLEQMWRGLFRAAVSLVFLAALLAVGYLVGSHLGIQRAQSNWQLYGLGIAAVVWVFVRPRTHMPLPQDPRSRDDQPTLPRPQV